MTFIRRTTSKLAKAYIGLSREMWILAIAMLINRSGAMVLLFMSVYLTAQLHFTIPQAGVVLSMFGFGSLVGAYLGGKLVDKIGFYSILVNSLLMSGLMIISLSFFKNYYMVAGITFMVTCMGDMFRPANAAAIYVYAKKENYSQAIALNRLAMNLGFTVGPMLGGLLAHFNYQFLFWVDGTTCILSAIFLKSLLPKRETPAKTIKDKTNKKEFSPYFDKKYIAFIFFTSLYAICFFQLICTFPLYFKNVHHLSESSIGLLMALNGVGVATIEMFLIYYIRNKWSQLNFISVGILFLIVAFLILIPFNSYYTLVVSIIALTISEMLSMPFMSTISLQKSEGKNMGDYAALYAMSWSSALILAPIIATQIISRYNFHTLWFSIAVIGFISLIGFQFLRKKAY